MPIKQHSVDVVFRNDPADFVPGTLQLLPLGYEVVHPRAGSSETWVYVLAQANLIAGNIVCIHDGASPLVPFNVSPQSGPWTAAVGVAQNTIHSGEYGFILKRGVGVVLYAGGAVATKAMTFWHSLTGLAAENSVDSSVGPGGLGYNLETKTAVADFTVDAWISCLG